MSLFFVLIERCQDEGGHFHLESQSQHHQFCTKQNASTKRKLWDNEHMEAALPDVGQGQSVTQTAQDYGIPKMTLLDHAYGRVTHGVKPGPRPYLNLNEEKEMGVFLKECSAVGYGKTRRDVLSIPQSVAKRREF